MQGDLLLPRDRLLLPVHREAEKEVGVIFVELKLGRRRAVFLHRPEDLWNTGGAALGDVEFLEEVADAAVAVASGNGLALSELVEPH